MVTNTGTDMVWRLEMVEYSNIICSVTCSIYFCKIFKDGDRYKCGVGVYGLVE